MEYVRKSVLKVDVRNLSDMLVNINNADLKALIKYVRMMGQSRMDAQLEVPKTELGKETFLEVADYVRTQGKMNELYRMVGTRGTTTMSPNPANINAVLVQLGSYELDYGLLSTRVYKAGDAYVDKAPKAEAFLELEDEAKLVGDDGLVLKFDNNRPFPAVAERTNVTCGTFKGLGDNTSCKQIVPGFVEFPMAEAQILQEASYYVQTKASNGVTTLVPSVVTQLADDLKPYFPEGMCDTVAVNIKEVAKELGYEPHGTMVGPEFAAAFINFLATKPAQVVRDSLHDLSTIMVNADTPHLKQFWNEKKTDGKVVWKATVNVGFMGGVEEKTRKESIPPYAVYGKLKEIPTLETTTVTLQSLLDGRGGNENAPGVWGAVSLDGLSIGGTIRAGHDFLMLMNSVVVDSAFIYVLTLSDTFLISMLKANYPGVTFVVVGKKLSTLNETRRALVDGGIIFARAANPQMFNGVFAESFVYLDLFSPMPKVAGKVFQTAVDTMTAQFQSHFRSLKSMWVNFVTKQYIGFMPKSAKLAPCITTHLGEVIYTNKLCLIKENFDYTTMLSYCIYQAWFVSMYRWHRYTWNGSVGVLSRSWTAPHPADGVNVSSGTKHCKIDFVSYGLKRVKLVVPDVTAAIAVGGTLDDFDMSLADLLPPDDFARLVENDVATRQNRDRLANVPATPKNNVRDIGIMPTPEDTGEIIAVDPGNDALEGVDDLPTDEFAQS